MTTALILFMTGYAAVAVVFAPRVLLWLLERDHRGRA